MTGTPWATFTTWMIGRAFGARSRLRAPIRQRRWHCRSCKSPPPRRRLLLRASGSPTEWLPSTLPRDRAIRLRTFCCSAPLSRTDLIHLRSAKHHQVSRLAAFQATVPTSGQLQFYRVERSGTTRARSVITSLTVTNGVATISFTGASSDSPSAFTLLSSPTVNGTYSHCGGRRASPGSGGSFQATVPANGQMQFYRVVRSGTSPSPFVINNLTVTSGVATISFTGASSDSSSAFTLLSSSTREWHLFARGGCRHQRQRRQFQATAPTSGPMQFYRIRK